MKKALITGIAGQDGSYLAEYLLELGYEVHGVVRRASIENSEHYLWRIKHLLDKIELHSGSLESLPGLYNIFETVKPDECYHLAAESFVSYSFESEFSTMNTNINGTHYVLCALHKVCPQCRIYFAGSSEMFGKAQEVPQNENTKFRPRSVYGVSKLTGFELVRNYRDSYNIFACSGILYNHESPRRGFEFVTRKISSAAVKIKLGLSKEVRLGNVEAFRDWGYAADYVRAMHAMINHDNPDDYVIATGKTYSVRNFLEIAFGVLGLDYNNYLIIDPLFYRPNEKEILTGDSSKAQKILGWTPSTSFEQLVEMMVQSDYDLFRK